MQDEVRRRLINIDGISEIDRDMLGKGNLVTQPDGEVGVVHPMGNILRSTYLPTWHPRPSLHSIPSQSYP